MRSAAIARPLEIIETEKALRAAIKEVLVCNFGSRFQNSQGTCLYLPSTVILTLLLCLCVKEKCG